MSACTKLKIPYLSSIRCQGFISKNERKHFTTSGTGKEDPGINSHICSKNDRTINDFASAANGQYMEYLFSKWIKDNNSVHKSWHAYFCELSPKSVTETSKKINKEKSASHTDEVTDYVDLIAKLNDVAQPNSVDAVLKTNEKFIKSVEPSSNGSDTVVAHIILTPSSDELNSEKDSNKPLGVDELIAELSKSEPRATNDKNETKLESGIEESVEQEEYLRAIQQIKVGLTHKDFNEKRDAINAQLKLINMKRLKKSLERNKK